MTKTRRRPSRHGRLKTGCISGLISIFDFRQERIDRRLLSDGRPSFKQSAADVGDSSDRAVDEACKNTEDRKENEIPLADMARTSVKELIEEEMLNDKSIINLSVDSEISSKQMTSNADNDFNKNQRCLFEEIGIIPDPNSSDKLDPETRVEHCDDENPSPSEEFSDSVKILTSDDGLFLELLQESDSVLLKSIPNSMASNSSEEKLTNMDSDRCRSHKKPNFFRRRSKTLESFPELYSCSSDKIFILKPDLDAKKCLETDVISSISSPSWYRLNKVQNSISSRFSFTEIKRRLWLAMGKEKLMMSDKIMSPDHQTRKKNSSWSSPNRNHFYTERFTSYPYPGSKGEEQYIKSKESNKQILDDRLQFRRFGEFNIYVEARKHLSEMVKNSSEGSSDSMTRQFPKTLGGIISLPVYTKSSCCSPEKCDDDICMTTEIRFLPCCGAQNTLIGLLQEDQENQSQPFGDDSKSEITEDIEEPTDEFKPEEGEIFNVSCEPFNGSRDGYVEIREEIDEDDESIACSKSEFSGEDLMFSSPVISTLQSPVSRETRDFDGAMDEKAERPSPVSVLEPLFMDVACSPASSVSETVGDVQPQYTSFEDQSSAKDQENCSRISMENEESPFEYVEAVLLGSGLDWNEFLTRWLSSQPILDSTLFEEVEIFSGQPHHDQKLLFDSTNEALLAICELYFGHSTDVKTTILLTPRSADLIDAIWKHVGWHLFQQLQGYSLDQLVRIDSTKMGKWVKLEPVIEVIGFEIEETIFDEMLEDTLNKLVHSMN